MTPHPSKQPPGVIFDLDGTLIDTLDDITDSINAVFEADGQGPVPRERVRELIGEGLVTLLEHASGIDDPKRLAALVEGYGRVYVKRMLTRTRLYPGVAELLNDLAQLDIPMSILSNKPEAFTVPICESLFTRWSFVGFHGSLDKQPRKPDPTQALEMARRMGRTPSNLFFVGDTTTDILTARNAGMTSVAVTWGYRNRSQLSLAEPAHWIDEPSQLTTLLQRATQP